MKKYVVLLLGLVNLPFLPNMLNVICLCVCAGFYIGAMASESANHE